MLRGDDVLAPLLCRDRERARDRERERERERPVREARDRSDREYVERSRTERDRERTDRERTDRERTDRERADRDRARDDRGRCAPQIRFCSLNLSSQLDCSLNPHDVPLHMSVCEDLFEQSRAEETAVRVRAYVRVGRRVVRAGGHVSAGDLLPDYFALD